MPTCKAYLIVVLLYSKEKQQSIPTDMEDKRVKEVYEFLKKSETYYIATMDGDQPRVRPFGTVDIFEDRLYIQTGKIKNVSKQIHANPKIEICGMAGDQWIRIEAVAVEDDRNEARQHMLDTYPMLKGMYAAGDGNTEVFYLKEATATIASFRDEPKVIRF
jgi:uncharacterized pyridoxamine 5'-phosphate oxidase family protein